ncbi:MAG: gliding motility-associated C-terminal domain-containing protein [Saprospiraceae bacterium]|nr:gliding motility-associated C-terminal domain-containing protein [Saprospiraceae bacterium]
MKKALLLFLFLISCISVFSQKQANRWYFADLAGLDFSSGEPVALTDGQLVTFEGCASISDQWGNHLFYSNGGGRDPLTTGGTPPGLIWNRNHEVMYDMSYTEGGGWSAAQSALVVPNPAAPNLYYLFTMEEIEYDAGGSVAGQPQGRGLSYFSIDMDLNGGLGEVTLADERIYVPLYETLSGTIHANRKDYWVIVADWANQNLDSLNRFGVVLVDECGVSDISWRQLQLGDGVTGYLGTLLKVSPNSKLILSGPRLYGFDNASGDVTDLDVNFEFIFPDNFWGASFSPNSRYLYFRIGNFTGGNGEIIRYDLEAADIIGSKQSIGNFPSDNGPGEIQLGPDGNIYFLDQAPFGFGNRISRINCPNSEFPSLEIGLFEFLGTTFFNSYGLPNFLDHIFESEQAGILDIGPDTLYICQGNSYEIGGETPEGDYSWNTGENTPYITISEPGTYILEASHQCGMVSDTLIAAIEADDWYTIDGPTAVCPGNLFELVVGPIYCNKSGIWSTGDTTSSIELDQPGIYTYLYTNNCGEEVSVEWEVTELALPDVQIQATTMPPYCEGEAVELTAVQDLETAILWSTGSVESQIQVLEDGLYYVDASNPCGVASDSLEILFEFCVEPEKDSCTLELPTVFSPNQDGLNDDFGLIYDCPLLLSFQLNIYNRWGEQIYSSSMPTQKWNGFKDEQPLPEDSYIWTMSVFFQQDEEPHLLSGEILLMR